MRKLNFGDTFKFVRLISKIGLKDQVLKLSEEAESFESLNKLGYEGVFTLITSATSEQAEQLIYEFLSAPFEMQPCDIQNMDIDEMKDAFKVMFQSVKIMDFIKSVSGLMK